MRILGWLALFPALAAGAHELNIHNFSQATWIVRAADEATRTSLTTLDQVSTLEVPGGESRRVTLPGEGTFAFRLIDAAARSGLEVAWTLLPRETGAPAIQSEVRPSGQANSRDLVRLRADSLAILAEGYGAGRVAEAPPSTVPSTPEAVTPPIPEGAFALPDRDPSPETQAASPVRRGLRRPLARRARERVHPYLTPNEWTALLESLGVEPRRDNEERKEINR